MRAFSLGLTAFCFMSLLNAAFAATPGVTEDFTQNAVGILQRYIRIDTTNPPGREKAAAEFLKGILDAEGIENELFDIGEGRACLWAHLPKTNAASRKKGVIMLHHMDVVPAEARFWKHPPFSADVAGGELYGRGVVDIKGKGIADLMTMIWFKRQKLPLDRDLFLLAVPDEEVGSAGTKWMVAHKAELLKQAEVVIDEGQTVHVNEAGKVDSFMVSTGEKSPLWLTLGFEGPTGHGSEPLEGSAANQALRAGNKILDFAAGLRRAARSDPRKSDTIALTMMKGSDTVNTISNTASLKLDCRLLPSTDKDRFIARLKRVVGNPKMTVTVDEFYQSQFSPTNTAFMAALRKVAAAHGVKAAPTILTSSTDASLYRGAGLQAYGFEPYPLSDAHYDTCHGNDERMPVEAFKRGIEINVELMLELAGAR